MSAGLNGGGDLTRRPFVGLTVKSWPEALRYCRLERGRSFTEVGKAVKAQPDQIKAWEYGKGAPERPTLRLLYQELPKLRNFAFLLPEDLKHEPHAEPTGEAVPAEVVAEVAKGEAEAKERPPRIPDPATYKTFGEALAALIKVEGVTRAEFAEMALLSRSRIDHFIHNPDTAMIQKTYDRLLSLLPDLSRAPKPKLSARQWDAFPGKKREEMKGKMGPRHKDPVPEDKAAKLERVRAVPEVKEPPPPPSKVAAPVRVAPTSWADVAEVVTADTKTTPPTQVLRRPVTAVAPPPPPAEPVDLVIDAAGAQALAEEMTKLGAAYGVAVATIARLRRSLALTEAQVREYHEKIQACARRLGVVTE